MNEIDVTYLQTQHHREAGPTTGGAADRATGCQPVLRSGDAVDGDDAVPDVARAALRRVRKSRGRRRRKRGRCGSCPGRG